MKNTALHRHLNEHDYPPPLWRFPWLVRPVHVWNFLVLQRNWLVSKMLRRYLPQLPAGGLVLDAGCGAGQHIFPFYKKHPRLRFLGIDKNGSNIAFCQKYTRYLKASYLHFFQNRLEEISLQNEAELIICAGTLQYIEDDCRVLENFYSALKPGGCLLLYSPVNDRSVLPFYRYFIKKLNHYEKSQNRLRIYSPEEIFEKVKVAGFEIKERKFTYGTFGIIGHEIYSLLLMGIANAGFWAWVFVCGLIGLLPVILILKWIDFFVPKKNGNGLMLIAEKNSGQK